MQDHVLSVPENSLWKLRLERFGKERFSGIMALQLEESGMKFQLLDATGITLLTAGIKPDGQLVISQVVPQVERTGLPGYLARGLRRIFLEKAPETKVVPAGLTKEARFWFMPLWRADYTMAVNDSSGPLEVYLDLWWPQPDMILNRLN